MSQSESLMVSRRRLTHTNARWSIRGTRSTIVQTDSANLLSDCVENDLCSAESISVRGIVELPNLLSVPSSKENSGGVIQEEL